MRLLIYYNAKYKRFEVVYTTRQIRHRRTALVDKYNRLFIQCVDLYDQSEKSILEYLKKIFK